MTYVLDQQSSQIPSAGLAVMTPLNSPIARVRGHLQPSSDYPDFLRVYMAITAQVKGDLVRALFVTVADLPISTVTPSHCGWLHPLREIVQILRSRSMIEISISHGGVQKADSVLIVLADAQVDFDRSAGPHPDVVLA